MRSLISRNGRSTSLPSWTIRMRPPCSTTNRRPEPSPASVTSTGDCRPPTTVVTMGLTLLGSKAATDPAGEGIVVDPEAVGPDAGGGVEGAGRGVTIGARLDEVVHAVRATPSANTRDRGSVARAPREATDIRGC